MQTPGHPKENAMDIMELSVALVIITTKKIYNAPLREVSGGSLRLVLVGYQLATQRCKLRDDRSKNWPRLPER